jgi:hypothetical protein
VRKDVEVCLLILAIVAFLVAAASHYRWTHWPVAIALGLALVAAELLVVLTG